MVSRAGRQCVIVVFPGHDYLLLENQHDGGQFAAQSSCSLVIQLFHFSKIFCQFVPLYYQHYNHAATIINQVSQKSGK